MLGTNPYICRFTSRGRKSLIVVEVLNFVFFQLSAPNHKRTEAAFVHDVRLLGT